MIQPPLIQENDKVIFVSPAGNIEPDFLHKTVAIFQDWGFKTEVSTHALSESGRFSGSVEQRLLDLQTAMDDPEAKVIFCSRGGYGIVHLLDKLNFEKIKKHPKWLIGYSDVTALHLAFQKKGIISLHAPMAKHFAEEGADDFAVKQLQNILKTGKVEYQIPVTEFQQFNRIGKAEGELFGGNLAVFCGLMGTKLIQIPKNGILFIEDIGEMPYKVDRFIHQLKLAGIFDQISGLIVGQFSEYEEDDKMYEPLYQSIFSIVKEYNFPMAFNFPVGHVKQNFPLIMGKTANLTIKENHLDFKQF